ncbi:MAG TPA: hypothetical protein VHU85_17875 [Acidimicrobiales bacterium]|jgi:predicted nucleic-acid-binding Zn-ribbon protein|nr:hypothetical protein [Acidimicrobiales bacterium]
MPEASDDPQADPATNLLDELEKIKNEQRARAADWLNTKWLNVTKQCPICISNQWSVSEVVEVRPYTGGGLALGGPVYPTFMVICGVCGYTMFFNAIIAGVLQSPEIGPQ